MDKETYGKITKRKQFSQLRKIDVELAWEHFEKRQTTIEGKIKLTRNLLGKTFAMFTAKRFLKIKDFEEEWILKRHVSTRERYELYGEVYSEIFSSLKGKINIFDLGAGVNGYSYSFLPQNNSYVAVESMGQLVSLMNHYFKKNNLKKAKAVHLSLFELEKIGKLIQKAKGKKVIFLFKVIDSLEMLKKDYTKEFLKKVVPLVDAVAISFATQSLLKKTKFRSQKGWILNFIKENFNLIKVFEINHEKYLVFKNK